MFLGVIELDMKINFPGGKKVTASINDLMIVTDQPKDKGGDGSAPTPFDLFITSIGTCAGYYVLSFCKERDITTENISLTLTTEKHPETKMTEKISIKVHLPADFPAKYKKAVIAAADLCSVKKHLAKAPTIEIGIQE